MKVRLTITAEGGAFLNPPKEQFIRAKTCGLSASWTNGLKNKGRWWNREAHKRLMALSTPARREVTI